MFKFAINRKEGSLTIESESMLDVETLKELIGLADMVPMAPPQPPEAPVHSNSNLGHKAEAPPINAAVAKLGAKSLREILEAAALVEFMKSSEGIFSKKAWFDTAQNALLWKESFMSNRAAAVKAMITSAEIYEKGGDNFTLGPLLQSKLSQLNDI
ncbi:MAG: hypothetical protein C0456_04030 [Hyphomonas sp.]|uniref:hypothetical protein n=1 Tax=Hyphomonas sp. TaxID=87 RepID=UPI001D652ACC|nr:hypothetical protein [Hyphomonas sp.]MBA4225778.1 hypothetical protein [Hyphomonas sp.]